MMVPTSQPEIGRKWTPVLAIGRWEIAALRGAMHDVQPRECFWRLLVKIDGQVRPTSDCVAVLEGRNELPSWGGV